ncbi:unnamed protein product, partial [Linum tenue]
SSFGFIHHPLLLSSYHLPLHFDFSPSPKADLPPLAKVKLGTTDEALESGSAEGEQSHGRWRRILFIRGASHPSLNLPKSHIATQSLRKVPHR